MSTKAIREALAALKAALDHPNAPAVIRGVWERAEAEVEAIEKELAETKGAILGPGGWKDVLTVETILHDRAKADLKKARQDIASLTEPKT